ncbi:hypothetical protein DXG01_011623, partial [Tephrocybe rancida]
MPAFLCRKFQEATEMNAKAEKYHNDMIHTLNPVEKETWEKEIERAEVDCLQDYKAMDVMKTRDVKHPTAMDPRDDAIAEGRDTHEDWMRLALMIEEQQQVTLTSGRDSYSLPCRVNIQDKAWRLLRHPRKEDKKEVRGGQERLASQITMLSTLQSSVGFVTSDLKRPPGEPASMAFDDLDGNNGGGLTDSGDVEVETTPKAKVLALPSSSHPLVSPLRNLEIKLRVEQADRYLQNLWAIIAEKSFLYTHVIRAKTVKAMMTRARGVIAKLNFTITSICRGYSHCRAALVVLAAPKDILNKYCTLHKGDTKSSTALLTPNIAGSTTLRLSWIWLIDSLNPGDSAESLRE